MKEQIVMDILREMTAILTQEQLMRLKEVVRVQLCGYDIRKKETALMRTDQNWLNYLQMYLDGFRQNGKSTGTIEQYNLHLSRMLSYVAKNVQDIEDDDLIAYMYKYRALRKVSNRYLNNMRLVFNCFFRWLQRRKVILRNPVDGLEPIKYRQVVKKPLSPEELEKVRCFSQMPKVNYYTSTNLVFENPGYNRLKVTDCNANYWWVYNCPWFDVNNWGNELDTKYQIGNRNDTVFDITNVKYVLIHTKQSENNNSGFGGCKFNLCNE